MVSINVLSVLNALTYAVVLAFVYPAYWAFDIRHALTVRVYRNQALGTGLVSVLIGLALFPPLVNSPFGTSMIELLVAAFYYSVVLGFFYFLDASMLACRRSDPLLRDTLRWSKLRIPLWCVEILLVSFVPLALVVSAVTGNASYVTQMFALANGTATTTDFLWYVNLLETLGFTLFSLFCFAIFLPPAAVRSKDPTLRRHFTWLAAFVVVFLALFVLFLSSKNIPDVIWYSIFIAWNLVMAFCLYRSARALVPLSRIQLDEKSE